MSSHLSPRAWWWIGAGLAGVGVGTGLCVEWWPDVLGLIKGVASLGILAAGLALVLYGVTRLPADHS